MRKNNKILKESILNEINDEMTLNESFWDNWFGYKNIDNTERNSQDSIDAQDQAIDYANSKQGLNDQLKPTIDSLNSIIQTIKNLSDKGGLNGTRTQQITQGFLQYAKTMSGILRIALGRVNAYKSRINNIARRRAEAEKTAQAQQQSSRTINANRPYRPRKDTLLGNPYRRSKATNAIAYHPALEEGREKRLDRIIKESIRKALKK